MNEQLFRKFDDIPWPPGGELKFAEEMFEGFRISNTMLWRFNISTPSGALHPVHPWPWRLCQGDSNPGDLLYLDPGR